MDETRNIVENTVQEYEETYGYNYRRVVEVICFAEFLDKTKNETKNIIINSYNIVGELYKIKQSSKGMIKLIKVIRVKIIIKGRLNNNMMDIYFKSGIMPILWRKSYVKVVNDRRNLYNRPQNYCEKHYCHFNI